MSQLPSIFKRNGKNMTCSEYILSKLSKKEGIALDKIIENNEKVAHDNVQNGLYVFTQDFHIGFIDVNKESLSGKTDECTENRGIFSRNLSIADESLLLRMKCEGR